MRFTLQSNNVEIDLWSGVHAYLKMADDNGDIEEKYFEAENLENPELIEKAIESLQNTVMIIMAYIARLKLRSEFPQRE